jgi:hypothetical protein
MVRGEPARRADSALEGLFFPPAQGLEGCIGVRVGHRDRAGVRGLLQHLRWAAPSVWQSGSKRGVKDLPQEQDRTGPIVSDQEEKRVIGVERRER